MRITFLISKMSNAGGTERVMSILSSELASKKHIITILTISDSLDKSFYELHPDIRLITTGILGKVKNPILKMFYFPVVFFKMRKAIVSTKPDVVVSFTDILNILTLISLLKTKISTIVTEHFAVNSRKIGLIWSSLRDMIYKRAKAIAVITPDDKECFSEILQNKITVVYNPVQKSDIVKKDYFSLSNKLVSAGRLVNEKGFDILIQAFSLIEKINPEIKLNIYGSGPEQKTLESLIKSMELQSKVFIHKPVNNLIEKLIESDILISSSKTESFGMVIAEAMSAGVPVISTDCPNGPRYLIKNNHNGILVENKNIEELAEKIRILLKDHVLREKIGKNAIRITEELSIDKFIKKWEELIK